MSVQLTILGFLLERDYHGYELKKAIEWKMGAWTDIKFGSIYHALGQLERSGFVVKVSTSSEGGKPARSIYSITELGRDEFRRLLRDNITNLQRIYLKEDIGVYFSGKLEKEEFADILTQHINSLHELKELLQKHRAEIKRYAPHAVNLARLLVTRHIMHIEVELAWFQKIRVELLEGK